MYRVAILWCWCLIVSATVDKTVVTLRLDEYKEVFRSNNYQEWKDRLADDLEALRKRETEVKQLEQQIKATKAEAKVSQQERQLQALFPDNWTILSHTVTGAAPSNLYISEQNRMATFNVSMTIRIFHDEWTVVPILDDVTITSGRRVFAMSGTAVAPLVVGDDVMFLLRDGKLCLVSPGSGMFLVKFTIHTNVVVQRAVSAVALNLLHSVQAATLRLSHPLATSDVVLRDLRITPPADTTTTYGNSSDMAWIDIDVQVVPTKTISIFWRATEEVSVTPSGFAPGNGSAAMGGNATTAGKPGDDSDRAALEIEDAVQLTVSHDALHAVAEGLLTTTHLLNYAVDSDDSGPTSLEIVLHGKSRVTSVTGLGVKSWKTSKVDKKPKLSKGDLLLRVMFKSSVLVTDMQLIIVTETEIDSKGDVLTLPTVTCRDVLRQTGRIGIVKVANVELHERDTQGVAKADPSELSSVLRFQTAKAIVMAYKYLSPTHSIALHVLRHTEVGVLDAVVEMAHYKAMVVDNHVVHSLRLTMQNTKRQYLRVDGIAQGSMVWSSAVSGQAVNPVRDAKGLLLPLLVGQSNTNDGGSQLLSIELAYLSHASALGESGNLSFAIPQLDLPISVLAVQLSLPKEYNVSFIPHGLSQVPKFSHSLPKMMRFSKGRNVVENEYDFSNAAVLEDTHASKASIKFQLPKAGRNFYFEGLLIVDSAPSIYANYSLLREEVPETHIEKSFLSTIWSWLETPL